MLVLLPFAATGLFAQRASFDVATFDPPAGWERIAPQTTGPLSFRSPDKTSQVFLFPVRKGAGSSPEDNFRADWARLVGGPFGNLAVPKTNVEQRADGWTSVTGAANLPNSGGQQAVLLFTATSGDRVFRCVGTVAGQQNVAVVGAFLQSLAFEASKSGEAGALSGLYFTMRTAMVSGARLEADTRFFLPGNRVARVFPFGSGDRFDPSRCSGDTCGAYTLSGTRLSIRWDNGRIDELAYESVPGEGIRLDGTLYRAASPVAAATLTGTWGAAGQTGVASTNVYRFAADGTFTFGTASQNGLGGRFTARGLTLILNYSDGDVRTRTLFAASPSMICIDGEIFGRR